jgi:hypothetical protein
VHPQEHHDENTGPDDGHQNGDHHFVGDYQYIAPTINVLLPVMPKDFILENVRIKPFTSEFVHYVDLPPKIPIFHILHSTPNRAPPEIV